MRPDPSPINISNVSVERRLSGRVRNEPLDALPLAPARRAALKLTLTPEVELATNLGVIEDRHVVHGYEVFLGIDVRH